MLLALTSIGSYSLHVYDKVFHAPALSTLHDSARRGGLAHTLFDRADPPQTPLEAALHAVLTELEDESPYVEYWWRDEWKQIEAHADVDEHLAARDGTMRCPQNAHVLYLQVGQQVRGPRKPTCRVALAGLARTRAVSRRWPAGAWPNVRVVSRRRGCLWRAHDGSGGPRPTPSLRR